MLFYYHLDNNSYDKHKINQIQYILTKIAQKSGKKQ